MSSAIALGRWLGYHLLGMGEEPFAEMNIQLNRKTNREVQELSKLSGMTRVDLCRELVWVGALRLSTHGGTPREPTAGLLSRGVNPNEFRLLDVDEVIEAERDTLQAMELATLMG